MAIEYNFKYMPLVGKLSGQSMVQQTETAINEIAKIVNDNTAQAEIINTLAEEANANSVEALEKANEAIETSSRYYTCESSAVNLNDYCEAQLIYINNAFSQNLPIAHKGFLEVKTNSNKTQATQVFADNIDRKFYVRTGEITATEVGDVTTYTASYGDWTNIPNSTDLENYLLLAGGTMSGDIEYSTSDFKINSTDINNDGEMSVVGATDKLNGASLTLYGRNHEEVGAFELNANDGTLTKTLKGDASGDLTWDGNVTASNFVGNVTGNVTGNATNDGNGNNIVNTYLPTVVGAILAYAGNTSPTGWLMCDGSAVSRTDYAALFAVIGTTYGVGDGSTTFNLPNLVNRMAVGAGGSYALGATGGEATHALTVAELAVHSHTFTGSAVTSGNQNANHTHDKGNMNITGQFAIRRFEYGSGPTALNGVSQEGGAFSSADGSNNNRIKVSGQGASVAPALIKFNANSSWSGNTGNQSANHQHSVTAAGSNSNTGSGTAHNNMPPYIGLRYIIKY